MAFQGFLKQSTATTLRLGPFVDKTDGVTYEAGMAAAMNHATTGVRISKAGGALAARTTATEPVYDAFGYYLVNLDATDTATVGRLKVIFGDAAVCLPCEADFAVLEETTYDALITYAAGVAGGLPILVTVDSIVTVPACLKVINATTIAGTGTQVAAAFVKLLNVATPTGTVNSLPDAVAGVASGLSIVGSEMLADVTKIHGSALSETSAGYLAAAFVKQYDVVTPVFTSASVNQTGDTYAQLPPNFIHLAIADTTGHVEANLVEIAGTTVSATTAQLGVNVVTWEGHAVHAHSEEGTPCVEVVRWDGHDVAAHATGQEGVPKVDLTAILGHTITQTGTQVADGFQTFFDVATPTGTVNLIPAVTTVATVSNQLTAAQIATGVWQDATEADFTATTSIGKSLYTYGIVPGASGGLATVAAIAALAVTLGTAHGSGSWATATGFALASVWTSTIAGRIDVTLSTRATAAACTEARLAELDADNLPAAADAAALVAVKLNTGLEADGDVWRATSNFLELAPGGAGATYDWTADERKQIRSALGIDGTKLTAAGGQLQTMAVVAVKLNTGLQADGELWRFTTNALELAPTGATASYTVGSAAVGAAPVVDLVLQQHAAISLIAKIVADVSQEGDEHVLLVYDPGDPATVLWSLDHSHVAIGADHVTLSIADDDANTATAGVWRYVLRNTTDDTVVCVGSLSIEAMPDVPVAP